MRTKRVLALFCGVALLTAGCTDAGTGVDADLTGTWVGAFPTSGELRLILQHAGSSIGGVGIIQDALGTGSLQVSGSWVDAELDLTLELAPRQQDPEPCQAGFTGRLVTPDRLQGRFTDCDTRVDMSLTRDPN